MMFNTDETNISHLDQRKQIFVISMHRKRHQRVKNRNNYPHITFMPVVCADPDVMTGGHPWMKSLLITPNKQVPQVDLRIVRDYIWAGSDKGWMEKSIFLDWCGHFITWMKNYRIWRGVPPDEPAVLFSDNHNSREVEGAKELLEANHIRMIFLIPHTSHICQPLDDEIFKVFKKQLRTQFKKLAGAKLDRKWVEGVDISVCEYRDNIIKAIGEAWPIASVKTYVKQAWANVGMHPWAPEKFVNRNTTPPIEPSVSTRVLGRHDISHRAVDGDLIKENEENRQRAKEHELVQKNFRYLQRMARAPATPQVRPPIQDESSDSSNESDINVIL